MADDRRRRSYFPAADQGLYGGGPARYGTDVNASGVAEGNARIAQLEQQSTYRTRRQGLNTYYSPSGGSITASSLTPALARMGYSESTPRELQFARQQGLAYGNSPAQNANPVVNTDNGQSLGGDYTLGRGVLAPYSRPGFLSNFWSGLQGVNQFAGAVGRGVGQFANNMFGRAPSVNAYAQNPQPFPTPGYTSPRRYFDE